jgi:hypothetical protein
MHRDSARRYLCWHSLEGHTMRTHTFALVIVIAVLLAGDVVVGQSKEEAETRNKAIVKAMTMLAAERLSVPMERVRFGLGDSAMPNAPQEGGSGLTGALGNAVQAACVNLVRAFVNVVGNDERSPLNGADSMTSRFATEASSSPAIPRASSRIQTFSRDTIWTR